MLKQLAEPFQNAKLTPHHNQAPSLRLGYILSSVSPSKPRQIGSKAICTILSRVMIPPPQTRDRFIRNFRGVFQASTKSYDQKRRSTSRRNEICLLSDNDSELLLGLVDRRALVRSTFTYQIRLLTLDDVSSVTLRAKKLSPW